MRHFSIARLMVLIAFIGAHFALLRWLLSPSTISMYREVIAGFLPLADGFLIAGYCVVTRYKIAFQLRSRTDRGPIAPKFMMICGLFLIVLPVFCHYFPNELVDYFETVGKPCDRFLRSVGLSFDNDTEFTRYILAPTFLGIVLSGPPLFVAGATAILCSRFQFAITLRRALEEAPSEDPIPTAG